MPSSPRPEARSLPVNPPDLPPFFRTLNGPGERPDPMLAALRLAEQGRFHTAPNPCVGAVLVKDGVVAAQGFHTRCGAPHAEVEAMADARQKGVETAACDLFVTLEPCNHHGKTPPCTQAILDAGIRRVVVGTRDPNPRVAGGGIEFLRSRGVEVIVGEGEEACGELIDDFRTWQECARPFVLLKLAATLDGRIASAAGHSQWISNERSRRLVHDLRARVQAVLVGGATLRRDDPRLTCRNAGASGPQPLAVIAANRLPGADEGLFLLTQRPGETVFFTGQDAAHSQAAERLRGLGCRVWGLPARAGGESGLDLESGLQRLHAECACHYVLCEGGGLLAGSLLDQGLADRLLLFQAPKIAGDDKARPMVRGRSLADMSQALELRLLNLGLLDQDLLLNLKPQGAR